MYVSVAHFCTPILHYTGGRKPIDEQIMARAMMMYEAKMTVDDITKTLDISRSTFYKYKNSH